MCELCDYNLMLEEAGLAPNDNRLRILEVIGANAYPLTAAEIFAVIDRTKPVNRVTVYRILDSLVQRRIVEKISGSSRAAHYGLAPNDNHLPHPHFHCTSCGLVDCLAPETLSVDQDRLMKTFAGEIERVDVRIEGTCRNCLKLKNRT
ncbi:Fur family transcriptional regulator [Desulforhopalus singaporensis]|uniref:Fur family transcriptional regulator, ferric uptake regulator n=1 Tax=Desulforhopalus singaporensis TaxID=91360 RepID=A0A1H0QAR4_9BACT|nr:transcriptional repressor [Desulforhopalus singaporensis]SDP14461.1 Fur family transcriptional regulator, ferric uptake regulator [Desulforhopalus singaporensis]